MRILTAAEVEREIHDINTRQWPLTTMLFMKNLYQRHPPSIGVLLRKGGIIEPQVRIVESGEGKYVPYESVKLMVEDGWVAD
jgi:hypothetical protein